MKISDLYVFGNRATCSYCRALAVQLKAAAFTKYVKENGIAVIDCDKTDKAVAGNYAKYGKAVGYKGGKWPQIFVTSDTGKVLGSFVARGMTAAKVVAEIKALCAECCEGPECEDAPATYKTCPTCKGTGKVVA